MTITSFHHGPKVLLDLVPSGVTPSSFLGSYTLSHIDAARLQLALRIDALNYTYNSLYCLGLAINGLDRKEYSWPTVELYYSSFYSARAFLALGKTCICHVPNTKNKRTHYLFTADSGKTANKPKNPSTHKLVLAELAKRSSLSFVYNSVIDGEDVLQWLMIQREFAHYRCGRLEDPDKPRRFRFIGKSDWPRLIELYANDVSNVYTLDSEHAMLALPLRLVIELVNTHYTEFGRALLQTERQTLRSVLKIKRRTIRILSDLINIIP